MKQCIIALVALLLTLPSLAARRPYAPLELEMSSHEYQRLWQQNVPLQNVSQLSEVQNAGQRNLRWVAKINSQRSADQKILMSDKNSLKGIPIESPNVSNETIILNDFNAWFPTLDPRIQAVLSGAQPPTETPPLPDADFQIIARKMDKFYQKSTRWQMQVPYLSDYAENRAFDIRGYYFLNRRADREAFLKSYPSATPAEQNQIKDWLTQMCRNSLTPMSRCQSLLGTAISGGQLNDYYQKFLAPAQANWESFFEITDPRTDVQYSARPDFESFKIPFTDPKNQKVVDFLKINVEEEWKGALWNLIVDMVPQAESRIIFKPGTVPQVQNGNLVVMDENQSLDDFENQWTIRHEFGHILRFPDCYIEFYDADLKAMISYQLDITNLMCSRAGHLLPTHYQKMKTTYGH